MTRPRPTRNLDEEGFRRVVQQAVDVRHQLHRHPELAFEEWQTSALVRDRLDSFGVELLGCPTSTGAFGRISTGRDGPTVLLRADIDALPVPERTGLVWASEAPGVMHACGHDLHTAVLLATAELLADVCRRAADAELRGEVLLLFQPAEEALGGARAMLAGGLLDGQSVDRVFGLHLTSLMPVGALALRPGVAMSGADAFEITLRGEAGHAAFGARAGNVVLAAAALAQRLSSVGDELSFDGTPVTCSAGVIQAGRAGNVVPHEALLRGTARTFQPEQRELVRDRIRALAAGIGAEYELGSATGDEAGVNIDWIGSTPPVHNDAEVTERLIDVLRAEFGDAGAIGVDDVTSYISGGVREALSGVLVLPSPASPSDDISELLLRVPGCYLLLGGALPTHPADQPPLMHHSGRFQVSDDAIGYGVRALAAAALDVLASG